MNESETIAEMILNKHDWQPKKIHGNLHRSGCPDFSCKDNKYVEVKKIVNNQYFIQIMKDQIKRWMKLLKNNKQIYLMIFTHDNNYLTTFEIKKENEIFVNNKI